MITTFRGVEMGSDLGKRLESLRESRNWSKTRVQKALGIKALSTYANYEYGYRAPSRELIKKIAELYDVSVEYLYGEEVPLDDTDENLSPKKKLIASIIEKLPDEEVEKLDNQSIEILVEQMISQFMTTAKLIDQQKGKDPQDD
ncbi:MAG: helix-turn-helix transcriptional regulator [Exiguobacterium chiriqhucha]|uniref:helix-turn-helix domain-containing protein n=1 Tax=Exiguobacterium chiriqhucha TaxID=1385984 RepID=UPI00144CAD65|nr:helix-turn-helix transcriptional regulator [Exiguobacterium chiriqhucha]KAB2861482.1 MAG: helix-turn-helix transcriptional regulator [Exiguobacterium chiriqhucha]